MYINYYELSTENLLHVLHLLIHVWVCSNTFITQTWTYLSSVSGSKKITAKTPAMHTTVFNKKGGA